MCMYFSQLNSGFLRVESSVKTDIHWLIYDGWVPVIYNALGAFVMQRGCIIVQVDWHVLRIQPYIIYWYL